MSGGGSRTKAAQIIVDRPHIHQFMVGPDTFAAEDALAEIPDHKRVRLFKGFEVGHMIEVCLPDPEVGSYLTQLAAVALAANNTGFRVLCDHEANDIAAVFDNPGGRCVEYHIPGRRGDTGGHQPTAILVFDQAHAAGAEWF